MSLLYYFHTAWVALIGSLLHSFLQLSVFMTERSSRNREGRDGSKLFECSRSMGVDHDGTTGTGPLLVVHDRRFAGLLGCHRDTGNISPTGSLTSLKLNCEAVTS